MRTAAPRPSLIIIAVILSLGAAYAAAAFLAPLSLAVFILALAWPVQQRLSSVMPTPLALVVTLIAIIAVIIGLSSSAIWAFSTIWRLISNNATYYQELYQNAAASLEERGIGIAGIWAETVSVPWLLRLAQQAVTRMAQTMTFWLVVLAYVMVGLIEVMRARLAVQRLPDGRIAERILVGCRETAKRWRIYMMVRTVISLMTGILIALFLLLSGVPYAVEWGVMGFVLNFIPFIGPLIATIVPSLFVLAQFLDPSFAAFVFFSLMVLQFLFGNYVEPRLSGDALSMSPFIVLVSIFLWTFLWGPYGTFIGVPIAIAIASFTAPSRSLGWISLLMGPPPPAGLPDEDLENAPVPGRRAGGQSIDTTI
ncbi:MAG: AI-2E family transporter [Rhizobium rhizophilum]